MGISIEVRGSSRLQQELECIGEKTIGWVVHGCTDEVIEMSTLDCERLSMIAVKLDAYVGIRFSAEVVERVAHFLRKVSEEGALLECS